MSIPNAPAEPILVSDQTVTPPLWSLLRYVLAAIGGVFVQKGALSNDTLQTILGTLGVIVPALWGAWLSIKNKQRLITAAAAAPNSVAKVV